MYIDIYIFIYVHMFMGTTGIVQGYMGRLEKEMETKLSYLDIYWEGGGGNIGSIWVKVVELGLKVVDVGAFCFLVFLNGPVQ